jgi:hypothetical protein
MKTVKPQESIGLMRAATISLSGTDFRCAKDPGDAPGMKSSDLMQDETSRGYRRAKSPVEPFEREKL